MGQHTNNRIFSEKKSLTAFLVPSYELNRLFMMPYKAWPGLVHGLAWHGLAWHGLARHGKARRVGKPNAVGMGLNTLSPKFFKQRNISDMPEGADYICACPAFFICDNAGSASRVPRLGTVWAAVPGFSNRSLHPCPQKKINPGASVAVFFSAPPIRERVFHYRRDFTS
jgi:hypothetical protein